MIRRFWEWLKALFGRRQSDDSVTQFTPFELPQIVVGGPPIKSRNGAARSANICLASKVATKRERENARRNLAIMQYGAGR